MDDSKRTIRKWRRTTLIGLAIAAISSSLGNAGEIRKPNVLIIVADDLGWGHVGWQNPKVRTPHLDRLAAGGIKLDQHYVAPVCSPTRVALVTGRSWSRFGLLEPLASEPTSQARAMPPGTATIATALRSAGYRTALVGKWHLGAQLDSGPEVYGFDHFFGIRVGGCTPLTHKWLGTGPSVLWDGREIIERPGHITDLLGSAAARWIAKESDAPFFLFLSFTAPHVPLLEADRWMDIYKESAPDTSHQLYWAAISHLDAAVGQVMAEIERKGEVRNTIVIFFGDNGAPGQRNLMQVEIDGDAYLDVRLPGDNLPLRGAKGDIYEGGIRTPAFITWPASLAPGTCSAPCHVTDWMPTLSTLAGHPPSKDLKLDGRNLMPVLGDSGAPMPDRPLYTGFENDSFALRSGDWKLVSFKKRMELYNIARDMGETKNLANGHPEIVQRLLGMRDDAAANDNDAVPGR